MVNIIRFLFITACLASAQDGGRVLFDGKTLNGWEARPTSVPDSKGDWSVQNGALVCGGTVPSWIHTNDSFSDFGLTLEFRGAETVNSGVFLRSQKEGQPHVTGYELQIWDYQPAGFHTGSLVGSLKADTVKILPGQWNKYDVTARGGHFTVVLNGKKILDAGDAKHKSGVIGFQCQKDQRIEFRNIKLQPLK
ncbi:MAG TPA: DUF1080 domain-containing protein [Bryobacteraceae bacterium]|nr:DUF1080 domain-containing protein [Bryobacteraceae bacterium]